MHGLSIRVLWVTIAMLLAAVAATAQTPPAKGVPRPPDNSQSGDKDDRPDFGTDPVEEMRSKLAIKADQKEYQENLARAREASELGSQILGAFEANKTIGNDEARKLERLEKITKKIRNDAGGQNPTEEAPDMPNTLEKAIKRVADLAGELRKDVEKTPRHVISAVVIDRANNLLGLIQRVRKLLN